MLQSPQTSYSKLPLKINIVAPWGGFGNHLRSLLLLSNQVSFSLVPTEDYYRVFAGPNWPDYLTYCDQNLYAPMLPDIRKEISDLQQEHMFLGISPLQTLDQKYKFLSNHVYDKNRSWQNWLYYEWKYRPLLNNIINFSHDYPEHISSDFKTICLTCDPYTALKSYLKFNSHLNNTSIDAFLDTVNHWNELYTKKASNKTLVVSSTSLFAPTLDIKLYNEIIDWLNFDSCYETANQLHQQWYNLHRKAEQEFAMFVTQMYQN